MPQDDNPFKDADGNWNSARLKVWLDGADRGPVDSLMDWIKGAPDGEVDDHDFEGLNLNKAAKDFIGAADQANVSYDRVLSGFFNRENRNGLHELQGNVVEALANANDPGARAAMERIMDGQAQKVFGDTMVTFDQANDRYLVYQRGAEAGRDRSSYLGRDGRNMDAIEARAAGTNEFVRNGGPAGDAPVIAPPPRM